MPSSTRSLFVVEEINNDQSEPKHRTDRNERPGRVAAGIVRRNGYVEKCRFVQYREWNKTGLHGSDGVTRGCSAVATARLETNDWQKPSESSRGVRGGKTKTF